MDLLEIKELTNDFDFLLVVEILVAMNQLYIPSFHFLKPREQFVMLGS